MITAMAGIPPTRNGDTEDVVWALQTADALWKRDERRDALVWLRRAAQAASDAEDDERALGLARDAADLADWVTRQATTPPIALGATTASPAFTSAEAAILEREADSRLDPLADAPELDLGAVEEVSAELIVGDAAGEAGEQEDEEEVTSRHMTDDRPVTSKPAPLVGSRTRPPVRLTSLVPTLRAPPRQATLPPPAPLLRTLARTTELPVSASGVSLLTPMVSPAPPMGGTSPSSTGASPLAPLPLLPGATLDIASAGPSDSPAPPSGSGPAESSPPPAPFLPVSRQSRRNQSIGAPSPQEASSDAGVSLRSPGLHVPTGAEAHAGMLDPWEEVRKSTGAAPSQIASSRRNSSATTTPAPERDEVVTSAPPAVGATGLATVGRPGIVPAVPLSVGEARSGEGPRWLESGPASEWPEAVRQSLARSAQLHALALDDEVFGFALAVVVEGTVEVAATIVDAPGERFSAGSVLRGKGTIDAITPLRLIARTEPARVATWREPQIVDAFQTCPWLDNQLRVAANRVQALAGVTLGPLGERLDATIRADITRRLTLRWITENEVVVQRGKHIPGLLVVGTGEIELSARLGAPGRVVLRSGEFLFPSEVLRAAPAPSSVRGAKGGALVLTADRALTQELLVTCPSLLEILAGA